MLQLPLLTPLRRIAHPLGDIYHAVKATDDGYAGFGEAYFTTVHQGAVKGWKQHSRMQLNLVVPEGAVCFYVRDDSGRRFRHVLGTTDGAAYARLTVPPGYWVAFRGVGTGLNLVLNVASIAHDPLESANAPLESHALWGDA
ncbi:hypothetical protein ASF61_17855 [Duganella sp. Leaf126]|nr:hypothetical protein ASF61_17855 [Duganella sp. Leaf126]